MTNESHIEWCRQMYAMMADGGTWAVPRSGLIFQKLVVGDTKKLVLVNLMPHDPSMSGTSAMELRRIQKEDYREIQKHFKMAGVIVWDENGLLNREI